MSAPGTTMQPPWAEPLTRRDLAEPVRPEPPRRGEPGGPPCGVCQGETEWTIWSDEHWLLHHGAQTSLPGTVWLATREHVDSFADLPPAQAREFGPLAAGIDAAVLTLPGVARTHVYRWGDGGAHFHVWFIPRPLGRLQLQGMMLPLWEDVLPPAADADMRRAMADLRAALDAHPPLAG
jgi:diadenosine tetraphosphate (Ap4A) HIT family hydrolase